MQSNIEQNAMEMTVETRAEKEKTDYKNSKHLDIQHFLIYTIIICNYCERNEVLI